MPLFAKRFIQRRDVKAVQLALPNDVIYTPDRELKNIGQHGPQGFQVPHVLAHLEGTATYGHYLLDENDMTRMFCYDIDLRKSGTYVPLEMWDGKEPEGQWVARNAAVEVPDLRAAWLDRAHPARAWLKTQMGELARSLTLAIQRELGIGTVAAYSGNKGIHVYGFADNPMLAADLRLAAHHILDVTDDWELERGQHQYRHKLDDPYLGFGNFSLEVFPKQDSLDGKDLGNLLRLPLGRNLKSQDPTFFLDLTTPAGVMMPHSNPVKLLESGDPYL